jgi:hypothetical protein
VADGDRGGSRVFIELKRDVPYETVPEETGLKIAFAKAVISGAVQPAPVKETDLPPPAAPAAAEPAKPWPRLRRSPRSPQPRSRRDPDPIEADGTLRDYKAFTISESPPRIVFDIPAVRTSAKTEQRIPVASGPVGRVRYLGYPDKVRVVIETQKPYLSRYSADPAETGLLVRVGDGAAAGGSLKLAAGSAPATAEAKPKPEPAAGAPAWVNRVEFADEADGKSAVIIGTTQPVHTTSSRPGKSAST